jgi:hypothetical protein
MSVSFDERRTDQAPTSIEALGRIEVGFISIACRENSIDNSIPDFDVDDLLFCCGIYLLRV